jgi:putative ATP-dependent endonuclease of the OLD family
MRILALEIDGFRGIRQARLVLEDQIALVGPNGSGKSTIVDALSLVFGRNKLVRELTEHDFTGSCPEPEDRIRIVATLGGFSSHNPADHPQWFRLGRAVEKWWVHETHSVVAVEPKTHGELCVQIGYAARFDQEELVVEEKRYFHDSDEIVDPFMEDAVAPLPYKLLREIGFFVLPARRTWPSTISFGSELFRKAVATLGGIPAQAVLVQRNALRHPISPLEHDPQIQPLVESINARLTQLIPGRPKLQLRVTSTDSESLLQALVPHYERDDGVSLPVGRHGTGLLSLQTLVLLLEIGRARRKDGESFILALEEPELHVPPGLQRRLIGEAAIVSDQVICTTHAPRVAAFFDARRIQILTKASPSGEQGQEPVHRLEGRPLAPTSMMEEANSLIQLYTDDRARLVEALMFPCMLLPEGRIDFEWLRLLLDVAETGERPLHRTTSSIPPFGAVVGVVPTRDSAVKITFERLRCLHSGVFALVDGDVDGDGYVTELIGCAPPPTAVIQWPAGWTMENAVEWVLVAGGETVLLPKIRERLDREFGSLGELTAALKNKDGRTGGLKAHYMAHEEIAGVMRSSEPCVHRVELLLEALTRAALREHEGFTRLAVDANRSTDKMKVYRFRP